MRIKFQGGRKGILCPFISVSTLHWTRGLTIFLGEYSPPTSPHPTYGSALEIFIDSHQPEDRIYFNEFLY